MLKNMVKLNAAFLSRKVTKKNNQGSENILSILQNLTHLHLQNSFIDTIGDISHCKNLSVLYLQNNCLTKLDNLHHATHLTHLYLQRNKISKIENLNGLKKLKKLYLGHNCIAVIEGLDKLCNLEELHIQNQQLPQGETLHFDPRSMKGLARCLHILDITGNNLTSVADLENLCNLEWLIARNNCLMDMVNVTQTVSQWQHLTKLELDGNPVCSQQKYREKIITRCNKLELLDGKQINDITREFLKKMEATKLGRQMAPHLIQSTPALSVDIANLTKNFPSGVRKSITYSVLQEAELRAFSNDNKPGKNLMFPAWILCSEKESYPKSNPQIPRPFWRQSNSGQAVRTRTKKRMENLSLPHV